MSTVMMRILKAEIAGEPWGGEPMRASAWFVYIVALPNMDNKQMQSTSWAVEVGHCHLYTMEIYVSNN